MSNEATQRERLAEIEALKEIQQLSTALRLDGENSWSKILENAHGVLKQELDAMNEAMAKYIPEKEQELASLRSRLEAAERKRSEAHERADLCNKLAYEMEAERDAALEQVERLREESSEAVMHARWAHELIHGKCNPEICFTQSFLDRYAARQESRVALERITSTRWNNQLLRTNLERAYEIADEAIANIDALLQPQEPRGSEDLVYGMPLDQVPIPEGWEVDDRYWFDYPQKGMYFLDSSNPAHVIMSEREETFLCDARKRIIVRRPTVSRQVCPECKPQAGYMGDGCAVCGKAFEPQPKEPAQLKCATCYGGSIFMALGAKFTVEYRKDCPECGGGKDDSNRAA